MKTLEGQLSADDSARLCRNYRYATKLLLGRHVWDNAQHGDAWGRRLPELRAHALVKLQQPQPA